MVSKVAIFGATGKTGLCVVEAAIEKNLIIKVLVRDPSKLPEKFKGKIEILTGNALNQSDVNGAVAGVDAVIVVLGTGRILDPTTDMSNGMKNIITAMKSEKVEKVSVCLSAFLFDVPEKVPKIFTDVNADHQRMFDALKESGMTYIAVLPPHIEESPSENYKTEFDKNPGRKISKYSLGKFLVECLFDSSFYGRVVGLCDV